MTVRTREAKSAKTLKPWINASDTPDAPLQIGRTIYDILESKPYYWVGKPRMMLVVRSRSDGKLYILNRHEDGKITGTPEDHTP